MTENRRYQERHFLEVPVKVANKPFSTNPPTVDAILSNISTGGIFVATEQDFPIASKMYLEFSIAFEDLAKLQFILSLESLRRFSGQTVIVQATGIVIRVQKGGSGIIFDQDYMLSPL